MKESNQNDKAPEMEENSQNEDKETSSNLHTLDDLADTLITEMPDVESHVVEGELGKQNEEQTSDGPIDKYGRSFDPEWHHIGDDGQPLLTASGQLRIKKQLRGTKPRNVEVKKPEKTSEPISSPSNLGSKVTAMYTVDTIISLNIAVFGPEWTPVKQKIKHPITGEETIIDEKQRLIESTEKYFETQGISDLPPGVALAMAWGAYALPRITTGEQTKSKLKLIWDGIKFKFNEWKLKRKGLNDPLPSRGPDRDRKNDNLPQSQ